MNTLVEIENPTATRLRGERMGLPAPLKFEREQVATWIAEDEGDH